MSAQALPSATALASLRQQVSAWWQRRAPRERQSVALVAVVLILFLVWSVLVQPALRTLREAPIELERLETRLQQMQRVAAESATLRATNRVAPAQAQQALKAATDRLGEHASLTQQGDRATLRLSGVSAEALREWLADVRSAARARPVDAQLQRGPLGYSGTLGLMLGSAG
jgi:general secretion pathway protein M